MYWISKRPPFDGLYQHTLIATGTRLRPLEATFLGHILGTNPPDRPTDRPTDHPIGRGTHIPHLLCRESYHLGSHFGTIWGWIGWVLGGFKTDFLWFLGLLKFFQNSLVKPFETLFVVILSLLTFVKKSPIKPVTGNVETKQFL